jgi:hypothetical protein
MMELHKTPYPRAGKTGSVDYLPVDKNLPHREDYAKNTRNGGR